LSQENVEIVKQSIDAFNRRDWEFLDAIHTADFEWFPALVGGVEGGSYSGRAGIEAYAAQDRDTWKELRVQADHYRDLGERVVMLGQQSGRGRSSDVAVDAPIGMIFDLRDGKISCTRSYLDHGGALRAAGLAD
jgi:ketosteroid isomerase-like protein